MATSPPLSGSPRKNTNNLLLFSVGAAAAVGAYYYMRMSPLEDLSGNAKRDEELMAQKARESLEAGKAHGDVARKEVLQKYEEAKAGKTQWTRLLHYTILAESWASTRRADIARRRITGKRTEYGRPSKIRFV